MPLVSGYHRPVSIEEALELLRSPRRVALGGGTTLNADRDPCDLEAVDLQSLELDKITTASSDRVHIGATVTLDSLQRCELLPDSLRELARAEQPSTLRTLATVGGLIAKSSPESLLLAGLLAHDVEVEILGINNEGDSQQASRSSLSGLLRSGLSLGALIIAVSVATTGQTAMASTARTPADIPIVAAYGRSSETGVSLALTGVADHPVLVDPSNPAAGLAPTGDFRGSRDYRLHLAATLTARVNEELI